VTGPLKVLEELGDEFERVANADAASGRRRLRDRLRRGGLLLAIPVALTVGGGAVAATQLLKGEPIRNPKGQAFRADIGAGAPKKVAGAVVTPLRVPDPDGGPPWGMRILTTNRDFGCVQVGRVLDGELGVLGQDGVMRDDGLFHVRPADVVGGTECRPHDGAGRTFIAIAHSGLPASGTGQGCITAAQRRGIDSMAQDPGFPRPAQKLPPTCPAEDLRNVRYGLLGSEGQSVTYRGADGQPHTVRVVGADGAYLVVIKPDKAHPGRGQWTTASSPMSGLISVQYRDGRVCRIRNPARRGGAKPCPLVGYVPVKRPKVTAAAVASPVTVSVSPGAAKPPGPAPPSGFKVPPQRRLVITFVARLPSDSRSNYTWWITVRRGMRHGSGCTFGGMGGTVLRDVDRGERVRIPVYVPADCSPTLDGQVRFHVSRPDDPAPGEGRDQRKDHVVGTFTVGLRKLTR
jgi:hypothetical protein